MARVHRLTVYPIKSLDGVAVQSAIITTGGALQWDRRWAIADRKGRWVCGKRNPKVFRLRAIYDLDSLTVQFEADGERSSMLHLLDQVQAIESWLSGYFGEPVTLQDNPVSGHPDDPEAYGPTLVSEASLQAVQSWFPELSLDNVRARFRANIEITDVAAFWEDRLFRSDELDTSFDVGAVRFQGSNPCQRCGVPMRDPLTGEPHPGFYERFIERRQSTLPEWADRNSFDHFYRFCINTRIPPDQAGRKIQVGDAVCFIRPDPESVYTFP